MFLYETFRYKRKKDNRTPVARFERETSSLNALDEESHIGAVARFHSYHVVLLVLILSVCADSKLEDIPSDFKVVGEEKM